MHDLQTERTLDLINRSLDGELSADEEHELIASATDHPAVARLLDEYQALNRVLAAVPQESPSPGLKASILAALPTLSDERTKSVLSTWRAGLVDFLQPKPRYALAWAASLAALVAIVALLTIGSPDVDPSRAAGTMADSGSAPDTENDVSALIASYSASVEGTEGRLVLHLGNAGEMDLEIAFDNRSLRLVSVNGRTEGSIPGSRAVDGRTTVRIAAEEDDVLHVLFDVSGVPDPVQVTLLRNDSPILAQSIPWVPAR